MKQRKPPRRSRKGEYEKTYLRDRFWRQTLKDEKELVMKGIVFKQKWEQACINIIRRQKGKVHLRNINTAQLAALEKEKGRVAKIESGV